MSRVLFVQGAGERGGAERVLMALIRHLGTLDVEPVVASLARGSFIDEIESAGVRVIRLPPAPRARAVWRFRDTARLLAAAAESVGASIIHSNGEKMALFGGAAARQLDCPSVVWLHDAPLRAAPAAVLQLALLVRRHDALVAGSSWMARAFRRRLGLGVKVVPHGIDLDILPPRAVDIRAEAGWPHDAVVVGHFARLQRWKGGEVFLRAAARVAGLRPEARFAVVGGALYGWEEEYAASLPTLAANLGIADRVCFLGHRDDALGLMAACDVVVHASLRPEPLGLVVLEAMALGRAVVATRTGGPSELLDEGRTGHLVRPNDAEGMAVAIERLVASVEARTELGKCAAETAHDRWSAEEMASRFATLYDDLTRIPTRSRT